MDTKKQTSLSSIKAAERVRRLFSKENQNLFYTLTKQLPLHHYDLVIVPKIPQQLRRLAFYGNQLKITPKKQRHWKSKQKEKSAALDLKEGPSRHTELNPHRVKLCNLKEHYLAAKRLKSISLQKKGNQHLKNHISLLGEADSEIYMKDQRMEYWEEFIKNREERHFNIGRIIKYLSD